MSKGKSHVNDLTVNLAREENKTQDTKDNEIRVAKETVVHPKRFFQMYKTKTIQNCFSQI